MSETCESKRGGGRVQIVYVIGRYWPATGGGPLQTRELAIRIARDENVTVVALCNTSAPNAYSEHNVSKPSPGEEYQDERVCVKIVERKPWQCALLRLPLLGVPRFRIARGAWKYLFQRFIASWIVENVHSASLIHNVQVGPDALTWGAFTASRILKIPFVHTPYLHPSYNPGWLVRIYRQSDAIVAMTERERERLISWGVAPQRVHAIGAGPILSPVQVDGKEWREKMGIRGSVVLFVGRKTAYKGCAHLLEAAEYVWRVQPDVYFVFAGPTYEDVKEAFDRRQDKRIINLPPVEGEEKAEIYRACDIFCMPSAEESLGSAYLEAWSCKKPVIACDIPALREVVEPGADGLLVRQDAKEIACAIICLLENKELRERMGEAGYKKVTTKYSWDNIAAKMRSLYSSLVGK